MGVVKCVPQQPFPGDYQLRVVVVFPDFDNHSYRKEVATGPVTSLKPIDLQSMAAMKVVATS